MHSKIAGDVFEGFLFVPLFIVVRIKLDCLQILKARN